MPRWVSAIWLLLGLLALLPLVLIARSRETTSARTRLQPIQDMGVQPKFVAQAEDPMFADGRAARLPVEGAVARGEPDADDHFCRGRIDGKWSTTFPMPVTLETMRRGRDRFNIYCAPCHGLSGYGNGPVAQRARELSEEQQTPWVQPRSYHIDDMRKREVGYFFNTLTRGYNNMPPYGAQIPVKDRWDIVAYIRALQRSQDATLEDVPPERREDLR